MVWPQPFIHPQVACDVDYLRPLASSSCLRDSAAWARFEGGALGKWLKLLEAPTGIWRLGGRENSDRDHVVFVTACTEVSVGKASPALAQDGEETSSISIFWPGELSHSAGRSV